MARELIGTQMMSHDCCALIVRRIAQIERSTTAHEDGGIWRKFMEPDFTTLVFCNIDPRFAVSVQREFHRERHIEQCSSFIPLFACFQNLNSFYYH